MALFGINNLGKIIKAGAIGGIAGGLGSGIGAITSNWGVVGVIARPVGIGGANALLSLGGRRWLDDRSILGPLSQEEQVNLGLDFSIGVGAGVIAEVATWTQVTRVGKLDDWSVSEIDNVGGYGPLTKRTGSVGRSPKYPVIRADTDQEKNLKSTLEIADSLALAIADTVSVSIGVEWVSTLSENNYNPCSC